MRTRPSPVARLMARVVLPWPPLGATTAMASVRVPASSGGKSQVGTGGACVSWSNPSFGRWCRVRPPRQRELREGIRRGAPSRSPVVRNRGHGLAVLDEPCRKPLDELERRLVGRLRTEHGVQRELVHPVLKIGTLLPDDDQAEIGMSRSELIREAVGLLVVQHGPEQGDPRCALDAVEDRIGAERQELAASPREARAEERPKTGLVFGGTTDEEERSHRQDVALIDGTGPRCRSLVLEVSHISRSPRLPSVNQTQRSTSCGGERDRHHDAVGRVLLGPPSDSGVRSATPCTFVTSTPLNANCEIGVMDVPARIRRRGHGSDECRCGRPAVICAADDAVGGKGERDELHAGGHRHVAARRRVRAGSMKRASSSCSPGRMRHP